MPRPHRRSSLATLVTGALAVALGVAAAPASGTPAGPAPRTGATPMTHYRAICGPGTAKAYGCHTAGDYPGDGTVGGTTPAQLQEQYGVAAKAAPVDPLRIAIIAVNDYPTAAADLAVYRAQFGLPACTGACFQKLDQRGGTAFPPADTGRGWSSTAAAGLQIASALCPACTLTLVEATSANFADLERAVATGARFADVVVAPFGSPESRVLATHGGAFAFRGTPVVVSTGIGGYAVPPQFPASSLRVTAVGGTQLVPRGRTVVELVNPSTVSGCSRYFAKPSFQTDTGCARRTVADTAALSVGVAVYDSFLPQSPGWGQVSGTGVSAAIIGGIYGLAGNADKISDARRIYAHPEALHDVVGGSNGTCGTYLCVARTGYDGPTGMGVPDGIGAF